MPKLGLCFYNTNAVQLRQIIQLSKLEQINGVNQVKLDYTNRGPRGALLSFPGNFRCSSCSGK